MSDLLAHDALALDIIRIAALLLGGIVIGLSVFVFRLYLFAHRMMQKRGVGADHATPYHVSLIATSHGMLVLAQLGVLIHRIGGENFVWWGAPIAVVAFSLSIWALTDMLRFENTQVNRLIADRRQ